MESYCITVRSSLPRILVWDSPTPSSAGDEDFRGDLREAIYDVGEIEGEITANEVLNNMFKHLFCRI